MTAIYLLHPEVAGGLGTRTEIQNRSELESGIDKIPKIGYLEYVFDGWLGDSLLTSFPVFIVTEGLSNDMIYYRLSGFTFGKVDTIKSDLFIELNPDYQLPPFRRLLVKGSVILNHDLTARGWSKHDTCLNQYGDLMVSERCMQVLQRHQLRHCEIKEIPLT